MEGNLEVVGQYFSKYSLYECALKCSVEPDERPTERNCMASPMESSLPKPMHRWHNREGMTLAGDSWGDPNGPLVVLMHGGGQTRHAWKGAGRALGEAGYHAVAYDARGHGDSDWAPDGDYSMNALMADLQLMVDELDDDHPILVGASLGGVVGLAAVGEGKIDGSALVLVDVAPRVEPEGASRVLEFMTAYPDGFASLDEVADAIAVYHPHRNRPRNLEGLSKNVRLGDDARYRWHWDPQTITGFDTDLVQIQIRLEAATQGLRIPTLLVRGGMSDVMSDQGVEEFRRLYPQAEYVNVENASHMVAGDRNDLFSDAVLDFLARHVVVGVGADRTGIPGEDQ
jgi:pimeloyl-ACP methyl ester carboxylesterase